MYYVIKKKKPPFWERIILPASVFHAEMPRLRPRDEKYKYIKCNNKTPKRERELRERERERELQHLWLKIELSGVNRQEAQITVSFKAEEVYASN